jgi:hypothetical protein
VESSSLAVSGCAHALSLSSGGAQGVRPAGCCRNRCGDVLQKYVAVDEWGTTTCHSCLSWVCCMRACLTMPMRVPCAPSIPLLDRSTKRAGQLEPAVLGDSQCGGHACVRVRHRGGQGQGRRTRGPVPKYVHEGSLNIRSVAMPLISHDVHDLVALFPPHESTGCS